MMEKKIFPSQKFLYPNLVCTKSHINKYHQDQNQKLEKITNDLKTDCADQNRLSPGT